MSGVFLFAGMEEMALRLAVAVRDGDYMRMLARAIRESEWRRKVTVVLMHGDDAGNLPGDWADGDPVLADADWCRRWLEQGAKGTLVCLADSRDQTELELDDRRIPCLFKYQSVHGMLAGLMDLLAQRPGGAAAGDPGQCRLVAVYSASGGSGKTAFAKGLAEWLAAAGCRAFYLNLERIPGEPGGGSEGSHRFARVLYHMRRGEQAALLALAGRHPDRGYDGFPVADHADEWNEYGSADIRELTGLLRQSGRWDFIVADCESALTAVTETVVRLADERFLLVVDDETGHHKSAFARRMLAMETGRPDTEAWRIISVSPGKGGAWRDFSPYLHMLGVEGAVAGG